MTCRSDTPRAQGPLQKKAIPADPDCCGTDAERPKGRDDRAHGASEPSSHGGWNAYRCPFAAVAPETEQREGRVEAVEKPKTRDRRWAARGDDGRGARRSISGCGLSEAIRF